jgi:hypothetical protein
MMVYRLPRLDILRWTDNPAAGNSWDILKEARMDTSRGHRGREYFASTTLVLAYQHESMSQFWPAKVHPEYTKMKDPITFSEGATRIRFLLL